MADTLRAWGLEVVEHDGWRSRGSSTFSPKVVIAHHTAGSASGDLPSLNTLVKGRADLPGPLCQVALDRRGRAWLIASGRANHAGKGSWRGVVGNTHALGIEAESTGAGKDWTPAQRAAYPRLCAALLSGIAQQSSALCGHREWAPGRKIDPAGIDLDGLRRDAQTILDGGTVAEAQEDDVITRDDPRTELVAQAQAAVARWWTARGEDPPEGLGAWHERGDKRKEFRGDGDYGRKTAAAVVEAVHQCGTVVGRYPQQTLAVLTQPYGDAITPAVLAYISEALTVWRLEQKSSPPPSPSPPEPVADVPTLAKEIAEHLPKALDVDDLATRIAARIAAGEGGGGGGE